MKSLWIGCKQGTGREVRVPPCLTFHKQNKHPSGYHHEIETRNEMRGPNVILTLANRTFISIDSAAPGLDTTVDKRLFRPCYVNGVSPPSIFFFLFRLFFSYMCARAIVSPQKQDPASSWLRCHVSLIWPVHQTPQVPHRSSLGRIHKIFQAKVPRNGQKHQRKEKKPNG